jgi:hypothetical protein
MAPPTIWPWPRRPFAPADIDLLQDALGDEDAGRALQTNAVELYRPAKATG